MSGLRPVLLLAVLGLIIILPLSGCCMIVIDETPSSKTISNSEAAVLEKGIKGKTSTVCVWPLFVVQESVRPLVPEGCQEPVGTERETKVNILLLFNRSKTKREKFPPD